MLNVRFSENILRSLLFVVIGILLTGCAGIVTMHNSETDHEDLNFTLGGKGYLSFYKKETKNHTKQAIREAWGEPDKISNNDKYEVWRYDQGGFAWAGIIPILIIPIPLIAPVGKNSVTFNFNGDELASVSSEKREGGIAICGLFLMDHPSGLKFGCTSGSGAE